jgi:hypothetical protein
MKVSSVKSYFQCKGYFQHLLKNNCADKSVPTTYSSVYQSPFVRSARRLGRRKTDDAGTEEVPMTPFD